MFSTWEQKLVSDRSLLRNIQFLQWVTFSSPSAATVTPPTGLELVFFCRYQFLQSLPFHISKSLPNIYLKKKKKKKSAKQRPKAARTKLQTCVSQPVTMSPYPGFEAWFSHCPISHKDSLPCLLQVPKKSMRRFLSLWQNYFLLCTFILEKV